MLRCEYSALLREDVLRVPDFIASCSVYLYRSNEDAVTGSRVGGSGLILGIPSRVFPEDFWLYAVTNRHVIEKGNSVIRVNRRDGGVTIVDLRPTEWVTHPEQDVAAAPVSLSAILHQVDFVTSAMLLTRDIMIKHDVGPGDDTFLVGRFVYADGGVRNQPSIRFGRISMNPGQPVRTSTGHLQESFLVECHSIGGYSGSPVFVYFHPFSSRDTPYPNLRKGEYPVYLLGIDYGHLPTKLPVVDKNMEPHPEGWGVIQNSGLMGVVPAWHIIDLLNVEEFVKYREACDKELKNAREGAAVLDSEGGEQPVFTKTDFEDALRKVRPRQPTP